MAWRVTSSSSLWSTAALFRPTSFRLHVQYSRPPASLTTPAAPVTHCVYSTRCPRRPRLHLSSTPVAPVPLFASSNTRLLKPLVSYSVFPSPSSYTTSPPPADTKSPPKESPSRPQSPPPDVATITARTVDNARQRANAVRERVRSSIPNLTPHENIYNLPNFLTGSRLLAAPAISYLLLHDYHRSALALFAYAGITDLVDGFIARRWNLQTVAGSVIDPMADKALMIILTVTLAIKGALPLYLATLILGRDASLALAAIYYRYASLPAPKTMLRYWDFSLPSAEVHPTTVSKYNTLLQLLLIGSTLALPVVTTSPSTLASSMTSTMNLHDAMVYFQYLVATTTAWSGLSYAFLKNAVTILGTNEELKAKQGARGRAIIGVVFGSVVAAAAYIALFIDEALPIEDVGDNNDRIVNR